MVVVRARPAVLRREAGAAHRQPRRMGRPRRSSIIASVLNQSETLPDLSLIYGRLAVELKPDFPARPVCSSAISWRCSHRAAEAATPSTTGSPRNPPIAWAAPPPRLPSQPRGGSAGAMKRSPNCRQWRRHGPDRTQPTRAARRHSCASRNRFPRGGCRLRSGDRADRQVRCTTLGSLLQPRHCPRARRPVGRRAEADLMHRAFELQPEQPLVL